MSEQGIDQLVWQFSKGAPCRYTRLTPFFDPLNCLWFHLSIHKGSLLFHAEDLQLRKLTSHLGLCT